ncbi:MAG: glycine oxidase ThiO [Planctomycetales bacterium]|nr:glycine oxidase ThiO [Planctomycetales bacterium]
MSDTLTSDCLIIGGGVIGLSLAYELACAGLSVHVVDQGAPGREASWAGAGILPPQSELGAPAALKELGILSSRLHAEWSVRLEDETGVDNGYRRCGAWNLATNQGEAAELERAAAAWRDDDLDVQLVDPDELAQLEPVLADQRRRLPIQAAALLADESQVRNPRHLRALLSACQRRGVTITANSAITDVEHAAGRVAAVQSGTTRISAGHYCVTAGAWSGGVLERLGASLPIRPMRGQIVLLSTIATLFSRVLNVGPRYLVPRADGRVLVGSTVEDAGFNKQTTADGVGGLLRFALELVPALADARLERTWAGLRPQTDDGLPYLGRLPNLANASVATGHFRSGLHLSTGTAVVMGQLIRGETPRVDLAPFSPTRQAN